MQIEFCIKLNFLEVSTQLRETLDFCYHGSVTHAGISPYGRVKYVGVWRGPPCAIVAAGARRAGVQPPASGESCACDAHALNIFPG
jgi:hypothetical protein